MFAGPGAQMKLKRKRGFRGLSKHSQISNERATGSTLSLGLQLAMLLSCSVSGASQTLSLALSIGDVLM